MKIKYVFHLNFNKLITKIIDLIKWSFRDKIYRRFIVDSSSSPIEPKEKHRWTINDWSDFSSSVWSSMEKKNIWRLFIDQFHNELNEFVFKMKSTDRICFSFVNKMLLTFLWVNDIDVAFCHWTDLFNVIIIVTSSSFSRWSKRKTFDDDDYHACSQWQCNMITITLPSSSSSFIA